MTAHTPGPWRDIVACEGYEERPYLIYAGAEHVASIARTDSGSDEANARLIAAAPDMLAALQLAQRYIKPGAGTVNHVIAKALAKADGR